MDANFLFQIFRDTTGTQTTMPEVLQKEIEPKSEDDKIQIEVSNHVDALLYGSDHLRYEGFSHSFIQKRAQKYKKNRIM